MAYFSYRHWLFAKRLAVGAELYEVAMFTLVIAVLLVLAAKERLNVYINAIVE